jgi:hypothetical protein
VTNSAPEEPCPKPTNMLVDRLHCCLLAWLPCPPQHEVAAFAHFSVGLNLTQPLVTVMAKTFDVFSEQSILNYQYARVRMILSYMHSPPVPAPLSLLSIPYLITRAGYLLVKSVRRSKNSVAATPPQAITEPQAITYAKLAGNPLLPAHNRGALDTFSVCCMCPQ